MLHTIRTHWFNYGIEAVGLGLWMVVMGCMATVLYAPLSPIARALGHDFWRGLFLGMTMGGSAIAIIYSPWGKRSGAHLNPAITLTFWRLNKLTAADALGYIIAQFIGGWAGIWLVGFVVGDPFTEHLHSLATVPQEWGWLGALIAEFLVAFTLMLTLLLTSNTLNLAPYTGWYAGGLIMLFALFITPISGLGLNPARSFASGLVSHRWDGFWIYYFAPCVAMLIAAEVYLRVSKLQTRSICCKLCPNGEEPCISIDCCGQCDALVRPWKF